MAFRHALFIMEVFMKVPIAIFRTALVMFKAEFIGTMETKLNKFLLGLGMARYFRKLDARLVDYVDKDGMVDVDIIKQDIDSAMSDCEGEFDLNIDFGDFRALGAKPARTIIRTADVEKFFTQTLPAVAGQVNK